jgi:RNA exonuclease 1
VSHFLHMNFGLIQFEVGTTPKASNDANPPPPPPPTDVSPESVLATLNTQLHTLYASLPSRTALIIFTGHSDPRRMVTLVGRKTAFENALKSGKMLEDLDKDMWWSTADGRELEEEVEKAKRGMMFLGIKP